MKGKDFTQKAAQEAVNNYYQLNPAVQSEADKWFVGTCSADFSTIEDSEGNIYTLYFTGSPQLVCRAYKFSNTAAFVKGQPFPLLSTYQDKGGYVLSRDDIYIYIRRLGDDTKYYLPIPASLANSDFTKFQTIFSSDGKAVFLGTVEQNTNFAITTSSFYHQIAKYAILKNFQLIDYTSINIQTLNMVGVNFSVPLDQGYHIAYVSLENTVSNIFDLNNMSDGNVPAPSPSSYAARSMFFPYSSSRSSFFAFGVPTNLLWDQDTGMQYYKTDLIPGASVDYYAQKLTTGNDSNTWVSSPNTTLFKNFYYVFNNDTQGSYNADLLATSVNCYLFGLTDATWTTSFTCNQQLKYTIQFVGPAEIDITNDYNETRTQTFSYNYPSDFAFTLQYFATPDVWLPIGVTSNQLSNSWVKNVHHRENNTVNQPPTTSEGSASYDAVSNTYISIGNPAYFSACQFAYASFYTVGPPWIGGTLELYTAKDFTQANYYTGLQRTYIDYFNTPSTNFPGIYLHFSGPTFDYADLNYDNLFPAQAATYYAVFAGRNSMVINDLAGTPTLQGIVSQILGDGNDYNVPSSAFRGRGFSNNLNTAFVYNQNFNGVYRYSSPSLFQGNLSNIAGTGQAELTDNSNQDPYTDAIAQLVDYQSLADVYGDTALVAQISNMIEVYRSRVVPSAAAVDSVIANIIALDSSLTAGANTLKTQLTAINGGLSGNPTVLGIDVIGFTPPDVFTDKIFSPAASWPFPQPGGGFLKGLDSYIVSGYYTDQGAEVIQNYNIDTTGLTSLGKKVSKTLKSTDLVMDYVLPVAKDSLVG